MALKRRKDNTPGGLATELAEAEAQRAARVQAAEVDYKLVRGNVIERGTQRIADLRELEQEARIEREQIESVLPV